MLLLFTEECGDTGLKGNTVSQSWSITGDVEKLVGCGSVGHGDNLYNCGNLCLVSGDNSVSA